MIARAARLPVAVEDFTFLGGVALTIAGLWWFGLRRRRTLSPDVDRFYRQELVRQRNLELVRGLYKGGPYVVIVLVVVALIVSEAPYFVWWFLACAAAWIAWSIIGPRLWTRFILPRLRP